MARRLPPSLVPLLSLLALSLLLLAPPSQTLPVELAPARRAAELPMPVPLSADEERTGQRDTSREPRPPPPREPPQPPPEGETLHPGYDVVHAAGRGEAGPPRVRVEPLSSRLKGGVAGNATGFIAVLENPAGHLSFVPGEGSHPTASGGFRCRTEEPAQAARRNNCTVAFNAGFFDLGTGECLGAFVHGGDLLQEGARGRPRRAAFGIDLQGGLVTGYLSADDVRTQGGGFAELIEGKGWLVRGGVNAVRVAVRAESIEPEFVTQRAPRTGVGHDAAGRVLFVQLAGREDLREGPTLSDLADVFVSLGAASAVNLDGGGSSVTVLGGGRVVGTPRCDDTSRVCTRAVPTIACIH